jgi:methylenetetrahydrofolate reductase (NADH)
MEPGKMELPTTLAEKLGSGGFTVTVECVPPKGAARDAVERFAAALPSGVDAAIVADNHEQITASALACAVVLTATGIEPVLTMVTRDRNRIALQSDVLGAAMLGVGNVLCLSGDHQSLGVGPEAAGAYDIDSVQLVKALAALRDQGRLLDGKLVEPKPSLFIGAAAHPGLKPPELAMIGLRKKVEAGAQFLVTSPVFDETAFREWMTALRSAGINGKTPIIATVYPLTSAEQAEGLRGVPNETVERLRNANDSAHEGIAIAAEIASKLKDIEGVRGIHVMSGGSETAAAQVIRQVGISRS